jgi:Uma2 family endonuclease
MSIVLQGGPIPTPVPGMYRLTVQQYHQMIASGVLNEDDRVELLNGYLVDKMPHDPMHDGTVQKINRRLNRVLPPKWEIRIQSAVTLSRSEPEPDLAIVREDSGGFMHRHPGPSDFGVVIEVANTTLQADRHDKALIYANNGLPVYWIVNVVDMQLEVFEQPSGSGYAASRVCRPGDHVPLVLDGQQVGSIPASDLLPEPAVASPTAKCAGIVTNKPSG